MRLPTRVQMSVSAAMPQAWVGCGGILCRMRHWNHDGEGCPNQAGKDCICSTRKHLSKLEEWAERDQRSQRFIIQVIGFILGGGALAVAIELLYQGVAFGGT